MIRTLLVKIFITFLTVLVASLLLVLLLFERRGRAMRIGSMIWSRGILGAAGVRVRIEGLENLAAEGCFVFVSNHQSNFDIPVLFHSLPRSIVFAAKKELFRIPLFGWVLRLGHTPCIDRQRPGRARAVLTSSARKLSGYGISVVVFPEGTRSPDGELRPFKSGAYLIARDLGAPLVPVAISGTYAISPKGRWRLRSGRVLVRIGPARDLDTLDRGARHRVMADLHDWVRDALVESAGEKKRESQSPS